MIKLPAEFEQRMKQLLGCEYDNYIKALHQPPIRAFRVNTDKISIQEFEKINTLSNEPVPYVDNAFYLEKEHIGNHPFHHAGMIYVQEPAAMAPAECIDIDPDWHILDMCAAPGGKSTQLKNKLGDNGVLVSNEIIPSRCKILTGNIERLGLQNVVTTCMSSDRMAEIYPNTFDLVMVDAPCSGEGMFRKDPNAINEWSTENVRMCAQRQLDILNNAVKVLKNGGYIIYATCTFSLEENEMTVDAFLKLHPEFEIVKVNDRVSQATGDGVCFDGCSCENISYARRFYPHKGKGEGQFMALLHNKAEKQSYTPIASKNAKANKDVFNFLDQVLTEYNPSYVTVHNERPVYLLPDFNIKNATAFSCGVAIGESKKGYFQPHHQLFMAMGNNFKNKVELDVDSRELEQYLKGNEFDTDNPNGWAVVCVNGCSVGGVKIVNGRAKNHYPKGIRIKDR